MAVFNPPVQPGVPNLATATKTRSLVAEFGDGYTQRGGDGLNSIQKSVPLTWNALSVDDADEIIAFLEAHKGYISFEWTPPRASAPLKWICSEWNRQHIDILVDSITCAFVQVFDL